MHSRVPSHTKNYIVFDLSRLIHYICKSRHLAPRGSPTARGQKLNVWLTSHTHVFNSSDRPPLVLRDRLRIHPAYVHDAIVPIEKATVADGCTGQYSLRARGEAGLTDSTVHHVELRSIAWQARRVVGSELGDAWQMGWWRFGRSYATKGKVHFQNLVQDYV